MMLRNKGKGTDDFHGKIKGDCEDTERRFSDVKLSTYAPVTNDCMDEK
jgi:hypothetical protein